MGSVLKKLSFSEFLAIYLRVWCLKPLKCIIWIIIMAINDRPSNDGFIRCSITTDDKGQNGKLLPYVPQTVGMMETVARTRSNDEKQDKLWD